MQQHKISKILDLLTEKSQELSKMYQDDDNLLSDELQLMRSGNPGMFSTFYETLNSTKEYHQRFPDQHLLSSATASSKPLITDPNNIIATSSSSAVPSFKSTIDALTAESSLKISFSGEEIYGKYLDLNYFYFLYLNLPLNTIKKESIDYIQYFDIFNNFFYIKNDMRNTKAYVEYVTQLWSYLSDFLYRIQPLIDLNELIASEWENEYLTSSTAAAAGAAGGTSGNGNKKVMSNPQPLRLGMFNSMTELEALGMERLSEALTAMGLKAGGTLTDRAERLWTVRGKKPEEYPKKLLAKAPKPVTTAAATVSTTTTVNGQPSNGHPTTHNHNNVSKVICTDNVSKALWLEFKITKITKEMMAEIVSQTRHHVEKQQIKTKEEKEKEIFDEEFGLLPNLKTDQKDGFSNQKDEIEDDEEPIYNPLNLPLGWDGKPIPYWLYKLHGLGVEYKCEICGNQSYWGRRAFDRHFQEWRHAHGMRCLGVPNTKHFHDITLIEDVLSLYSKIKESLKTEQFVVDVHEEYEDSEGNVLNRKTYEDLARQGLL